MKHLLASIGLVSFILLPSCGTGEGGPVQTPVSTSTLAPTTPPPPTQPPPPSQLPGTTPPSLGSTAQLTVTGGCPPTVEIDFPYSCRWEVSNPYPGLTAKTITAGLQLPDLIRYSNSQPKAVQVQGTSVLQWNLPDLLPNSNPLVLSVELVTQSGRPQNITLQHSEQFEGGGRVTSSVTGVSVSFHPDLRARNNPVNVGDDLDYTLTVEVRGASVPIRGVLASVFIPPEFAYVEGSARPTAGANFDAVTRTLTFGAIPVVNFNDKPEFQIRVKALKPGKIKLTATVSTNTIPPASVDEPTTILG